MRNLTKVAIAVVLVSACAGVILPVRGDQRQITVGQNGAVRTNGGLRFQLIQQGHGQKDQDLRLLLALKIFASSRADASGPRGSGSGRNDHIGSVPRGSGNGSDGRGSPGS